MRKIIKIKVSRIFVIGCVLALLLLVKLFLEYTTLWKTSDIVFGVIIKGYEGLSIIAGIACFIFCWLIASCVSWVFEGMEKEREERNK